MGYKDDNLWENLAGDEMELENIVETEELQLLMDNFYRITKLPMAIIDLNGKVLVGTGWQDICTKFHRVHPEARKHCIESDTELSSGVLPGSFKLYKCKNNMWDITTPIVVNGIHVGNVFMGQFFFEDETIDYELFREQARKYGFDEKEYMAALERVPRWSRETVHQAMGFFTRLAHLISTQGHNNIKLQQSVKEREETLEELRKNLERMSSFLDQANIGWFVIDKNMCYIEVNKIAAQNVARSEEEIKGKTIYEVVPEFAEEMEQSFRKVLETGQAERNIEVSGKLPGSQEKTFHWLSSHVPLALPNGKIAIGVASVDITQRKQAEEELQRIEWMLDIGRAEGIVEMKARSDPSYGKLTELNTERLILDSIEEDLLIDIAKDYLNLLETSSAIYEKNGDYALGIFSSGWCRFLDSASRELCQTDDNSVALLSGKWLCHESCWTDAAKVAIETGQPTDIPCHGGIRLYTVPIWANEEVVGAINFGYGDPPQEPGELQQIAEKYSVSATELARLARAYESRPPFIIELAKNRLYSSARLIGSLIEQKRAKERVRFMSFHDHLTTLYNRRFLEEEMQRLDTKRQLPISVIMADLNGLKLVNDTYGHNIGDNLLTSAARILKTSCRHEDIIARWGGDEFVILLPQTVAWEARNICKRITNNCKKTYIKEVPISLSLGVATKESEEQSLRDMLRAAEDEMYRQKLAEGRSTKSSVVNTLLKTLETKSLETEEHTRRMEKVALKIGEKLEFPDSELQRLKLLITLHDIGKINIPEEILSKNGALTVEEWEAIKKHPETGYRIARATEEFSHVAEDILAHHERWDGSGYPRGLKGKEIPLLARIASIADAYEVMSNGRPYKKALSQSEIIDEVKRCAGSQFDPALVEIFLSVINDF